MMLYYILFEIGFRFKKVLLVSNERFKRDLVLI